MSHEQFEVGKQQVDKWFSSFREDLSKLDSHKEQDLIMDISSDSIVVAEVEDSAALCGAIKRVLDTLESLSH